MEEIFFAALFGLVQGVAELLPISSSAHIALLERLTGYNISIPYEAILNLGSFIAIVIYFRSDINILIQRFLETPRSKNNLLYKLILSAIPVLGIAFIFKDYIEQFKYNMPLIAFSLISVGILLYIVDKYSTNSIKLENVNTKNYLMIGALQSFSLVRGVSRSSITILTSRIIGINREDSVKISFLMSLPILLIVSIYGIFGILFNSSEVVNYALLIGFLSSFLGSYLAIKILMNIVKKYSFLPFALYRIILGILILIYFI